MSNQKDCNNCCSLFLRNLPHKFCVNSHSSESGHIGCAMKLGEKIKPVRIHRGLTQRELGERLRLDGNVANRIAQYESGFRTPKESRTKETAKALDVREDNFFPKAETPVITPQNAAQLNQAVTELIEVSAETAEKDKK